MKKRIKLTAERWNHVVGLHPEVKDYLLKMIKNVLLEPDLIIKSRCDPKVFLYHSKVKLGYLVVVVKHKNSKGFILTAYIGNKVKEGDVVWKKRN